MSGRTRGDRGRPVCSEGLADGLAATWVSDPNRAMLEMERFLHLMSGCPADQLPRSLDDCKIVANSCSLGRWYTQVKEPALTLPIGASKFIRNVAVSLVEMNLVGSDIVKYMVNFLGLASTWPLNAARQSAVYIALNIITGLGGNNLETEDPRLEPCKAMIVQLVDSCFLGRIQLDTSNDEPYHPPLMQIRDKVLGTRYMIMEELDLWLRRNPDFYFPLCHGILTHAINDRVGTIALSGIKILIYLIPKVVEGDADRYIVDLEFMESVKEALTTRVLQSRPRNKVGSMARIAILDFVSRKNMGEPTYKMSGWMEVAHQMLD